MDLFELSARITLDRSEYEKGLSDAESESTSFGSKIGSALGGAAKVGAAAIGVATGAAVAFVKSAVDVGAEFDSSMSQVAATLGLTTDDIKNNVNGAGDTFQSLRDKAKEMGAATNFSASEAAEGLNILAMSGYDAESSMAMLEDVLHLAAAGSMEMSQAAGYISGSMKGFADESKSSAYYADLMAKGATLANTSVSQLGEAMSSGAAGAAAYSQTADSMTISLLRLAEQGEVGSAAGTALAAAMKNLYTPTDEAKVVLEELGVAVYDSAGNARDFNDVTNELSEALAGYTEEEANAYKQTIFGIQGLDAFNKMTVTGVDKQNEWAKALASASVNMSQVTNALKSTGITIGNTSADFEGLAEEMVSNFERLGGDADKFSEEMRDYLHFEYDIEYADAEKAINEFVSVMEEQTGEAAKQYDTMTDNLQGDIDIFNSAMDGLKIAVSDQVMPAIREAVQSTSDSIGTLTEAFEEGGLEGLMEALGEVITNLTMQIVEQLPGFVDAGMQLIMAIITGILDNLPQIASAALQIIETIINSLVQNLPKFLESGKNAIIKLAEGISSALPDVKTAIETIISNAKDWITNNLPGFLDKGVETVTKFANGLLEGMPDAIRSIGDIINGLFDALLEAMPTMIEHGIELIVNLASGIRQNIPEILIAIGEVIAQLLTTLAEHFPEILESGIKAIGQLAAGFIEAIPEVVKGIKQVADAVIDGLKDLPGKALQWGKDLVKGFVDGIKGAIGSVKDAVGNVASTITENLHFSRPDVGPLRYYEEWMPDFMQGLAKGIKDNVWRVEDAVSGVAESMNVAVSGSNNVVGSITPGFAGSVTVNVYGAEGQDETVLAEKVAGIINEQVNSGRKVWYA